MIQRCFIWIVRLFTHVGCPNCGAYHGHSPSCVCATRTELEAAYRWTQGRLSIEREDAQRNVGVWARQYEEQKRLNGILKHENNQLRKAMYPGKC